MSLREQIFTDNLDVFLNCEEFAEPRDIAYDGVIYEAVPSVLTKVKEVDRSQSSVRDHAQGIYLAEAVLHCRLSDLDGVLPEKGGRLRISQEDGFMRAYLVAKSGCELGMVRLELEILDE